MRGKRIRAGAAALLMMLISCALAYLAVEQTQLRAQIGEAQKSLETNQQRKAKQEYEFSAAQAALAEAEAELAQKQPPADAAKAEDTALRAERKELRAEIKALRTRYDAANTEGWAALEDAADAAILARRAADSALMEAEQLSPAEDHVEDGGAVDAEPMAARQ